MSQDVTVVAGKTEAASASNGAPVAAPAAGESPTAFCGTVKLWLEEQGIGLLQPDGVTDGALDVVITTAAVTDGQALGKGAKVAFSVAWSDLHQKYEATKCVVTAAAPCASTPASAPAAHAAAKPKVAPAPALPAPVSTMPAPVPALPAPVSAVPGAGLGDLASTLARAVAGLTSNGGTPGCPAPAGALGMAGVPAAPMLLPVVAKNNLFVAGLPPNTSEDRIKEIFGAYGQVLQCKVLPNNGKNDTASLVRMGTEEQARWLVSELHGNIPLGLISPVTVRYAENRAEKAKAAEKGLGKGALTDMNERYKPYGGGPGLGYSGAEPSSAIVPYRSGSTFTLDSLLTGPLEVQLAQHSNPAGTKVWVGSVPVGATHDCVRDHFAKFGPVTEVFLKEDARVHGRLWAFVTYLDAGSAQTAVLAHQIPGSGPPSVAPHAGARALAGGIGAPEDVLEVRFSRTQDGSPSPKLWIGSIPLGTTVGLLRMEFSKYGPVIDTFLKDDPRNPGRMWAFVTFGDMASAQAAVNGMHQRPLLGAFTAAAAAAGGGPAIGTDVMAAIAGLLAGPMGTT